MSSVSPSNEAEVIVTSFLEALRDLKLDAATSYLAPHIRWDVCVESLRCYEGLDDVTANLITPLTALFGGGEMKYELRSILSKGNFVLCETRASVEWPDRPMYKNQNAWAFTIEDSKIVDIREYLDSYFVAQFTGVAPRP
jgi:limonene-1,2-epoxide hydrolase